WYKIGSGCKRVGSIFAWLKIKNPKQKITRDPFNLKNSSLLQLVKNGVHQTFFIVDALFQGYHGLRSTNSVNIVYLKNNIFGMIRVLGPYFTKNVEFPCSNMGYSYVRNLI